MVALVVERMPVAQRSRPHRITVDIDPDQFAWLAAQRRKDRIRTTERIRALLQLAMKDEQLHQRVLEMADRLREDEASQAEAG